MSRELAYKRMVAARNVAAAQLALLERGLRDQAQRAVASPAAHRGDSAWRKTDEDAYQTALARLRNAHRQELGTLTAKLRRQQAAIREAVARNP